MAPIAGAPFLLQPASDRFTEALCARGQAHGLGWAECFHYIGIILMVAAGLCRAQPPLEEIRIDRYVATPMRDGVKLYGDLYRPKRDGKFPVLVVRTPYGVQRD